MKYTWFLVLTISIFSCTPKENKSIEVPTPVQVRQNTLADSISDEIYYDKVLGALVGSAIGDAMGAPTEMWAREEIVKEYGYVNGLTLVIREKSAEGPWQHQMDSGATTDDTRWKYLMGEYFTKHSTDLSVDNFASFIIDYYQSEAKGLAEEKILTEPDLLDEQMQRINWIKEWARVALAYQKGGTEYFQIQNRFYGGEMSCAGMLYTPMFGLIAPDAESAYTTGFEHGLFDLGYGRDIAGIVAAMTQLAMREDSLETILRTSLRVDPYDYMNSRLIGRLANAIAIDSRGIIKSSLELPLADTLDLIIPKNYQGSPFEWLRQDYIYSELTKRQKAIAFHAGEIWQILYTGLLFGEGDFEKTMRFIVNYGRDNDTVAAVAGMILGAKDGYSNLPTELKEQVLKVNREVIGIDLEQLAKEVVASQKPNVN